MAEVPYYIQVSIAGHGVSSIRVKEGAPFTVHLEGVGWTQLDNTVAVDYDNSYMGYGAASTPTATRCSTCTPLGCWDAPHRHLPDALLALAFVREHALRHGAPAQYGSDDPALALGYHLPALRFAITVVR